MWQRVRDKDTGGLAWVRSNPGDTKITHQVINKLQKSPTSGSVGLSSLFGFGPWRWDGSADTDRSNGVRGTESPKNGSSIMIQQQAQMGYSPRTSFSSYASSHSSNSIHNRADRNEGIESIRSAGLEELTSDNPSSGIFSFQGFSLWGDTTASTGNVGAGNTYDTGNNSSTVGLREVLLQQQDDDEGTSESPAGIMEQGGEYVRPTLDTAGASRSNWGDSSPRSPHRDDFGDPTFMSESPGYTSVFDPAGGLRWEKIEPGQLVYKVPIYTGAFTTEDLQGFDLLYIFIFCLTQHNVMLYILSICIILYCCALLSSQTESATLILCSHGRHYESRPIILQSTQAT